MLTQKECKNEKNKIYDKTPYVWITKSMPVKKNYTTAGCDGWDNSNVWYQTPPPQKKKKKKLKRKKIKKKLKNKKKKKKKN